MDDLESKLILAGVCLFLAFAICLTVDSVVANYMRFKAIDRVLATLDGAVRAGAITKEEFLEDISTITEDIGVKGEKK